MDYSYLKKEVENQQEKAKREFYEAYEREKEKIADYICVAVVKQVKGDVTEYYKFPQGTFSYLKRPNIFRSYWLYSNTLKAIAIRGRDDNDIKDINRYGTINSKFNTVIFRDHDYYDFITETAHVPVSKLSEFCGMLNNKLKEKDIRIELITNKEGKRTGDVKIIANLGKL